MSAFGHMCTSTPYILKNSYTCEHVHTHECKEKISIPLVFYLFVTSFFLIFRGNFNTLICSFL